MRLVLETYTPSEAEAVTQVTQATVRNWRRAGYLPRPTGHARYTVRELMLMSAMHALVSRGLTPEAASGFARSIANATFMSCIRNANSFSESAVDGARKTVGEIPPERIEEVKARAGDSYSEDFHYWADSLGLAMDTAERQFGLTGIQSPNYFIIWANGEEEFAYHENICEKITEGSLDEFVQGPVTLFTLAAMAGMILDRLPRKPITTAEEG